MYARPVLLSLNNMIFNLNHSHSTPSIENIYPILHIVLEQPVLRHQIVYGSLDLILSVNVRFVLMTMFKLKH